ncbi:hypothetical protein HDV00_011894 [Rhizophlyctis rosea]|nr:hypothetical protein HDV00_011894 [Rhizophlyctis rosea]
MASPVSTDPLHTSLSTLLTALENIVYDKSKDDSGFGTSSSTGATASLSTFPGTPTTDQWPDPLSRRISADKVTAQPFRFPAFALSAETSDMQLDRDSSPIKRKRDSESFILPEAKVHRISSLSSRLAKTHLSEPAGLTSEYTDVADSMDIGLDHLEKRPIRRAARSRNSSFDISPMMPSLRGHEFPRPDSTPGERSASNWGGCATHPMTNSDDPRWPAIRSELGQGLAQLSNEAQNLSYPEFRTLVSNIKGSVDILAGTGMNLAVTIPSWRDLDSKLQDAIQYISIVEDIKATVTQPLPAYNDLDTALHHMRQFLEGKRRLYGGGLADDYWEVRGLPTEEIAVQRSAFAGWVYESAFKFFVQLHTTMQSFGQVATPAPRNLVDAAYHLLNVFLSWTVGQSEQLDTKTGKGREARVMLLFDNVVRALEALRSLRQCGVLVTEADIGMEDQDATLETLSQLLVDAGMHLFGAASSNSTLPSSGRRTLVIAMACKYVKAVTALVDATEDEKKRMKQLIAALPAEAQQTVI